MTSKLKRQIIALGMETADKTQERIFVYTHRNANHCNEVLLKSSEVAPHVEHQGMRAWRLFRVFDPKKDS